MRWFKRKRALKWTSTLLAAGWVLTGLVYTYGQDLSVDRPSHATSIPASQPARVGGLTVAVLDFTANTPGAPELGSQIGEALTAFLSGEPGFTLLDRTTLARVLQEHELNLSGVVDTHQAIRIGKLVGARILVTGRAFQMGNQMFITVKIIGTETSLVDAVLVKSSQGADLGDLVMELGSKVGDRLRSAGPRLVAEDSAGGDPLPALKKKLKDKALPKVAVIVTEDHYDERQPMQPIDPAVETEIKRVLRACGIHIQDIKQNELADWARLRDKNDVHGWPRGLQDVDLVITGEAFSEFAARIGNLVSCSARVEVNVIRRADGKVVLADRETCRAVDLSEHIAGKKALQKAGRTIGIRILDHLAAEVERQHPTTQRS